MQRITVMGSAEDAVRRREAETKAAQEALRAAQEVMREGLIESVEDLATKIRNELDRLEWPVGVIGPLWNGDNSAELAHLVIVPKIFTVGSDGHGYYLRRFWRHEEAYEDKWYSTPPILCLEQMQTIFEAASTKLDELRGM